MANDNLTLDGVAQKGQSDAQTGKLPADIRNLPTHLQNIYKWSYDTTKQS